MTAKKFHSSHDHRSYKFPRGFLWGTATSAHQIEGGTFLNDWATWERTPKKVHGKDTTERATGHYKKFEDDIKMMASMGHSVYRLSIEWSRIEPEQGYWDLHELEHYTRLLKLLKKHKIKVMLTLHHFTLPQWVADAGGWEHPQTIQHFTKFTQFIAENLYRYVDFWITINEPMVFTSMGYIDGLWPPGKKSLWSAYNVLRNLIKGHKQAYRTLHTTIGQLSRKKVRVGIAKNVISFDASNKSSFLDITFVFWANQLWNHLFFKRTKRYHDFIGVNYYFHQRLERKKNTLFSFHFSEQIVKQRRNINDIGWEIYPSGIYTALLDMRQYNLPVYITENGVATDNDSKRIRFILSHLLEINRAIHSGVKIKGYCHWSLLDNFEWHLGYKPRFGLVHVNYKTLKRTPKRSAQIFSEIARENMIDHDLMQYLGHTPYRSEPQICKIYEERRKTIEAQEK
jgi:beta-glucosidase